MESEVKFVPKTGMWRCRDGSIACVWYIIPTWMHTTWPLTGFHPKGSFLSWWINGRIYERQECDFDLIEHLSDEIADPRTWQPPVVLREGVWEFSDGSRGVAFAIENIDKFWVYFSTGKKRHWSVKYEPSGTSTHGPRATRFIGPLPTGDEK